MTARSLKGLLSASCPTIGSWLSFGYPPVAEMMAKAGFDWLVVDMEHTGISTDQMFHLIQVIDLAGCIPLVRVGANDPLLIKRAMDAGAHGVIVPMVNTAEDARAAVQSVRYPPAGRRGVGLSRAQGYGLGFSAYKEWADRESVLIVQIEHHEGVANLDEILGVDGVDGFIIGPYDLSGSLGVPGQFDHPAVEKAMATVTEYVRAGNKPGGAHVVHSDRELLRRRISEGYKFLAYGDDMVFLAEKLEDERRFVASLRVD